MKMIERKHGFRSLALMTSTGCVLTLIASSNFAHANGADIVNQWIADSANTEIVAVSADDVSYSGLSSKTTVQNLQVTISLGALAEIIVDAFGAADEAEDLDDASYNIVFPEIELTNLIETAESYSVDAVRADALNLDVELGAAGAEIPPTEVSYESFTVDDLTWAKLPEFEANPDKPISQFLPLLRSMIDFSFSEMTIDNITSVSPIAPEGPPMTAKYGPVKMGKTVRGDVSTLDAGQLLMEIPTPPGEGGGEMTVATVTAQTLTAANYNYGTMLDTLFAPAETATGEYKTAIGEIELGALNISVPSENVEVNIGSFVFENMGVRTPDRNFIAELETLALMERSGEEVDMSEEEIVALVASIYGAFSIGKFEIAEVDVSGPEIKTAQLGSYGMTELSSVGLGSFYMQGIDVVLTNGDVFKYGKSTIENVGFPDLSALIALEKNVEAQNIEEVLKGIPTIGRIENSGIDFQISEEDLEFSLGKSVLEMSDHIGPVPTRIAVDVDNLKAPVDKMDDEPRQVFEQMGYSTIDASYDMQLSWDEATQDLNVMLDAALTDGGRLKGDAKLGSIPRLVFEKPDQTAIFSLFATTLKNINVEFEDQSIVERGLGFAAAANGTDVETIKAQAFALAPVVLGQVGAAELAADVTAAMRGVIENGSKLVASAAPVTPLPLVSLGSLAQSDPAALIQSLNVTVGNQ